MTRTPAVRGFCRLQRKSIIQAEQAHEKPAPAQERAGRQLSTIDRLVANVEWTLDVFEVYHRKFWKKGPARSEQLRNDGSGHEEQPL
jgi:hypothetical protein